MLRSACQSYDGLFSVKVMVKGHHFGRRMKSHGDGYIKKFPCGRV